MARATLKDLLDPRSGSEEDPTEFASLLEARYGMKVDAAELKKKGLGDAVEFLIEEYRKLVEAKGAEVGDEMMRRIERFILLTRLDERWKDHLYAMDQLKAGIGMRAYAQIDPKVAYKREGYEMFNQMISALRQDVTELILKVQVRHEDEDRLGRGWRNQETVHGDGGGDGGQKPQQATGGDGSQRREPIRNVGVKIGRNDPCPCGSGKKYKKCHGRVP
jgi:preprotein translocase subunit SecA